MSTSDTHARAEARESLARIHACLDAMDDSFRAVFVMFEIEGFKAKEIALALGIPEGTVHSRLHRARALFREQYEHG